MDKVCILGLTADCIKEGSIMVSNMGREFTHRSTANKYTASGRKARKASSAKTNRNSY